MLTGHARLARQSHLAVLLVLTVAVLLIQPPTRSFAQKNTFVATGRAKLGGKLETAQRRALENALWLAVEQAIQSVVPAEARVEHTQAITAMLARPRQHVTSYEVIQRGPSRGYFIVKVRATVAMGALASRLQAQAVPVGQPMAESQPTRPAPVPAPTTAPTPAAPSADPGTGQRVAQVPAAAAAPQPQSAPTPNTAQSQPGAVISQAPPQPDRPRIAILLFQLGFTNPNWAQNWDISLGVTELVEEALHSSGRYRIVERRQIEQVLKEQGFGSSGSVDAATAAKIGRILGVQRLVMGSVNQFDFKAAGGFALPGVALGLYQAQVNLTSRVVDTSTGEIIAIVRGSGKAEGFVALAQIEGLTFGGGEFRQSVLGKALDQAIQDLVGKLNGSMSSR